MTTFFARFLNEYKFKYHTLFAASFYRINEEDQGSDEFELFFNFNVYHNSTEPDVNNIDVKSQLKLPNQIQETKESGGIFD